MIEIEENGLDGLAAECTVKQRQFCQRYLAEAFNGTKAYKQVYSVKSDGVASANASRLLGNAKIQSYLKYLLDGLKAKNLEEAEKVIEETEKIGFANISDFVEWGYTEDGGGPYVKIRSSDKIDAAAIRSIKLAETRYGSQLTMTMHNKIEALRLLGMYHDVWSGEESSDSLKNRPIMVSDEDTKRALEECTPGADKQEGDTDV